MIHYCKQIFIACHRHYRSALAHQVFLDPVMTENPYIVEVGERAAPTTANCDTLD